MGKVVILFVILFMVWFLLVFIGNFKLGRNLFIGVERGDGWWVVVCFDNNKEGWEFLGGFGGCLEKENCYIKDWMKVVVWCVGGFDFCWEC